MNIYEYYEDDEYLFIVGEIYRGGELFDRMISDSVHSESTVAHIMKQILSATFHCHQNNIIHRFGLLTQCISHSFNATET